MCIILELILNRHIPNAHWTKQMRCFIRIIFHTWLSWKGTIVQWLDLLALGLLAAVRFPDMLLLGWVAPIFQFLKAFFCTLSTFCFRPEQTNRSRKMRFWIFLDLILLCVLVETKCDAQITDGISSDWARFDVASKRQSIPKVMWISIPWRKKMSRQHVWFYYEQILIGEFDMFFWEKVELTPTELFTSRIDVPRNQ